MALFVLRGGFFGSRLPGYEHERPPESTQTYLLTSFDLLTIPSPTTALPFPDCRFHPLLHRNRLPRLSSRADREVERKIPSRGQGFAISQLAPR